MILVINLYVVLVYCSRPAFGGLLNITLSIFCAGWLVAQIAAQGSHPIIGWDSFRNSIHWKESKPTEAERGQSNCSKKAMCYTLLFTGVLGLWCIMHYACVMFCHCPPPLSKCIYLKQCMKQSLHFIIYIIISKMKRSGQGQNIILTRSQLNSCFQLIQLNNTVLWLISYNFIT